MMYDVRLDPFRIGLTEPIQTARGTIGDLVDLDLAYSPPYGNAKDPVNLAGMVGRNLLDESTIGDCA